MIRGIFDGDGVGFNVDFGLGFADGAGVVINVGGEVGVAVGEGVGFFVRTLGQLHDATVRAVGQGLHSD